MSKKINSKKYQIALGLTLSATLLSPAVAQQGKIEMEQQPLIELPNSISGTETVRSRMNTFIREQKLREIKDNKKDETGRVILIDFASATIAAPPSDANFVNARITAFNKAMLNAKAQCTEFQKTSVSTEAVKDVTQPPAERARDDAEQLKRAGLSQEGAARVAQALNSDIKSKADMPKFIQTAALYGEKLVGMKMAEELRKKGLDPSKPVEAQAARAIAETESFKKMITTVAAARCSGIKALATFEQNPSTGQGEVGVITVWTDKLLSIADAIVTNQWDLIPKGEPGKKVQDHIPDDMRTLLATYGAQLVRDEKGEYVLLAYAQAQPRSKNQQSISTAYEVAKTRGMGLIRSFMGEAVETNRELLDAEVSTAFVDGDSRFQDNSSFQRKIKSVGEALPISGMTVAHEWETLHPSNNGPVVGVVMQWKVESAKIAGALAVLNQASVAKAQAAATGSNSGAATPAQSAPSSPRKTDANIGQGKSSKEF
jgi:hypothetical protein